jgi:oligopeptide transport system permease protein
LVFLVYLGLYPLVLLGIHVGWAEAGILLGGILLIGTMAFYPPPLARGVGSLWLAAFLFVFLQTVAGFLWGVLIAVAAAGIAAWLLPTRVHRRIGFMVPSMVLLVFVTTVLMYMAPGNPFAQEKQTTQQALEAMKEKFKVYDTPLHYFGGYMGGILKEGTLGLSVKVQGRTVEDLLLPALPVSMSLGLLALVIACALGLYLGIRAGLKPNSFADYSSMGLAMVGISLPNFVIGAVFLIVFSYGLGWLPVAGWGSYRHLLLPAVTLALPYAAYVARLARNGTIEVLQQDFVRTARAKGLSERAVILKHALKGAILPVVSFLGPAAAGIFTGSFVVETLFQVPGMGQWFVKGATGRDYSVVLGTAIIYFTIITLFNLLVDFAYAWLDPRVREEL